MKLSDYARSIGISYRTAHRWFKDGSLPVKSYQSKTGTIIVEPSVEVVVNKVCHLYARVSSHDQKEDLVRQLERLRQFASTNGYIVKSESTEIASGMNQNRPKLIKLLKDNSVDVIIVEHKDRLTRFGFNLLDSTLSATGRKIVVINDTEQTMDLVQDFIDVVTSMCSRIYGKRSSKNKVMKIQEICKE